MLSNFSIVYAVPMQGRREFNFDTAELMAEHIQRNRPGLFVGTPKLEDEKYAEKRENLLFRPFSMPQERKEK